MQVSPITTAPVTTPFRMTVTMSPDAYMSPLKQAQVEVQGIAASHGVEVLDWKVLPMVLESYPPQSVVTGSVRGAVTAVDQALTAIEALDREI